MIRTALFTAAAALAAALIVAAVWVVGDDQLDDLYDLQPYD